MKDTFCKDCEHCGKCTKPCIELETHLRDVEKGRRGDTSYQSGDYMARKHHKDCFGLQNNYKAWDRRCQVVQETIEYFSAFGRHALEYFVVWQLKIEHSLSHSKISQLTGMSKAKVSKIVKDIKAMKINFI